MAWNVARIDWTNGGQNSLIVTPHPAVKHTILALLLAFVLTGCLSSLTTGDYNQPVRLGMTDAQLKAAIGNPEVVTKRTDGSEVWVYSFGLGIDAKSAFYVVKDGKVVEIPANATSGN